MGSIVLKSLSILLGFFFVFVGLMKLTPKLSKDMHKDLRREYVKFAKAFPMQDVLQFKMSSKWYRRVVGGIEVVFGLALAIVPHVRVKQMSNIILLLLMAWTAYTHYIVNNKFERIAPTMVFFFMLTCRIIVAYQLQKREANKFSAEVISIKPEKQIKQE